MVSTGNLQLSFPFPHLHQILERSLPHHFSSFSFESQIGQGPAVVKEKYFPLTITFSLSLVSSFVEWRMSFNAFWSGGMVALLDAFINDLRDVDSPTVKGITSPTTHFENSHLKFSFAYNNFGKWSLIDLWLAVPLGGSSSFHLAFRKSVYSSWCVHNGW